MDLFTLPNGRQVILAAARGLRLDLDAVPPDIKVSASTRKTQARGERVAEKSDVAMIEVVADALVRQALTDRLQGLTASETAELRGWVAQGIYEFVQHWDHAVRDTATFTPAARRTTLVVLPFVRLGLLDLALRLQARAGLGLVYFLSESVETRAREVVDGSAFVLCLKKTLELGSLRRIDLVDAFTEDTVRAWEEGALPIPATMRQILAFLDGHGLAAANVGLELRLSIALCELWSWLEDLGIPESARVSMAEGFLSWLRIIATLAAEESVDRDERFMTIVRGARNSAMKTRLETLSDHVADPWLEADILHLGSDWTPRCRFYSALLGDIAFAAEELRRTGVLASDDAVESDVATVAHSMCIPRDPFSKRDDRTAEAIDAANLEGLGTVAMQHGNPVAAVSALRDAARLNPDDPWPRIRLAQALYETGDCAGAEKVIRAALDMRNDIADAWLVLGAVVLAAGRPGEARAYLEQALEGSGQPAVVHAYRAAAFLAEARAKEAGEAANAGLACDRKNVECWRFKSLALAALGDAKGAARAADEVRHRSGGTMHFSFGTVAIPESRGSSKTTHSPLRGAPRRSDMTKSNGSGGGAGGKTGSGGKSTSGGKSGGAGWPSKTGQPSGGKRDNAPPKK
ncbi:MAG: tetratricopeptide repeat protein [Polyangiales bacterium]